MNIKKLSSMAIAALFVVVGTTGVELNASAITKSATDVVVFAEIVEMDGTVVQVSLGTPTISG